MLLTIALTSSIALASPPRATWKYWESPGAEFKVKLPGPVDEEAHDVATDSGVLTETVYTCDSGTAFYQVSAVQLPPALIASDVLVKAEEGAKVKGAAFFAEGVGVKDGAMFRRYRVELPKGPMVSHMVTARGNKFFHLIVVAPPTAWRKARPRDFFDSFAWLDKLTPSFAGTL